jgi:purine catabolism regulator
MTNPSSTTLEEFISLVFPTNTRVLGRADLARKVAWIVMTTIGEVATRCSSDDFVLLIPPYPQDLASRLNSLTQIGVAGVAIVEPVSLVVTQIAEQKNLAIIPLPASADLRALERAGLGVVVNRSTVIEQRASQVYEQLMVLSAENEGLDAMTDLIGTQTNKSIIVQDKRLNVIASWYDAKTMPQHESIETWVASLDNLPEELHDRKRAAQLGSSSTQSMPMPAANLMRIIVPIIVKGMARGYFSMIAPQDSIGVLEQRIAERSAAACAIEMAKAKAVSEAEKRVRGTFVDALLSGSLSSTEAAQWARHNRYDPEGKHAAIVADWAGKEHPTYRRLETLVHGLGKSFQTATLVQARDNEVVIFAQLAPRQGIETARHLAETIRHQSANEFPNDPLAIGIGRVSEALIGLRDSYREARQALSMARRLASSDPLYFGELNVYRLLFQLEDSPELASFTEETIGKLIAYDRAQGTDLIETLNAYFAHNGNLSATAEALYVHRNTLLYRMERIREISGLDFDNSETRLSVQLALRAHRLLLSRIE